MAGKSRPKTQAEKDEAKRKNKARFARIIARAKVLYYGNTGVKGKGEVDNWKEALAIAGSENVKKKKVNNLRPTLELSRY